MPLPKEVSEAYAALDRAIEHMPEKDNEHALTLARDLARALYEALAHAIIQRFPRP